MTKSFFNYHLEVVCLSQPVMFNQFKFIWVQTNACDRWNVLPSMVIAFTKMQFKTILINDDLWPLTITNLIRSLLNPSKHLYQISEKVLQRSSEIMNLQEWTRCELSFTFFHIWPPEFNQFIFSVQAFVKFFSLHELMHDIGCPQNFAVPLITVV